MQWMNAPHVLVECHTVFFVTFWIFANSGNCYMLKDFFARKIERHMCIIIQLS
jgi:hypothetical protein